jgi:hypothetical protein
MWNDAIELICYALKETMCTTSLFMAMLDFSETFVIKCDASREALGAMLMQEVCQLAFNNKHLCE